MTGQDRTSRGVLYNRRDLKSVVLDLETGDLF